MNQTFSSARRRLLRNSLGLSLGGFGLVSAGRACEFQTATLRITHPYCLSTAVSSEDVVVGMKFDEVIRADRLVGASSPVARGARIGGLLSRPEVDFAIPAGEETWLHERGTWLLLTGLEFPLQLGRAYPLRLDFEHGGTALTQLTVDFPGLRSR